MKTVEILKESQVQKEKFRIAANKLLNSCFLIKKKEDTRNDYIFILQNKELFIEYFDLLGYRLEISESQGVVSLINSNGTGRLRLKKIESILLLLLRLLYLEKRKELSLTEDVVVLTDELNQKYSMLKIDSKSNLDKTTLRETLRLFRKYNLVTVIDKDAAASDARIKIYPSILFAVSNTILNSIYDAVLQKLTKYAAGGETGDDEDLNQD